jgi:hypothetical protein
MVRPEEFARGALALYTLTFGWIILFIAVIPSALVVAGAILLEHSDKATAVDPAAARMVFWGAIIIGLFLAGAVVLFFYWGAKSILRGKVYSAVFFLICTAVLHIPLVLVSGLQLTINWFSVAVCGLSLIVVLFRRGRLFQ